MKRKELPTLSVEAHGVKLKVIRVGKSPRLKSQSESRQNYGRASHIHSHFTYEVFFITDGELELVTGEGNITFGREVAIIPPHVGHYSVPSEKGSFCLLFSVENGESCERAGALLKALGEGIRRLPISEDVEYYIGALARKSEAEIPDERSAELLATLIFCELVGLLIPNGAGEAQKGRERKHIGAIEAYINSNFSRKITLSDVAGNVYLSGRQVSRIIRKEYGCTLSELVNDKKLASAKMLLKNTDLKVGEIAAQVNLGAENYFYAIFKKKYGLSPLQYRKRNRASDQGLVSVDKS